MASPSPHNPRGEGAALYRQPVLLRQLLQRHLRPRADMLDHLGGRQRAEPAGILVAGIAHQPEQESGGEQIAGAGGVDQLSKSETPAPR